MRIIAAIVHTKKIQKNKIDMTLEDRKVQSKTSIFKAVFPNTTNHYDTLFGEERL